MNNKMTKEIFNNHCKYFIGKWEDNDRTGIPLLTYCNHKNNPQDFEGNCNIHNCPLKRKIDHHGD
jgi:hypothetical protein